MLTVALVAGPAVGIGLVTVAGAVALFLAGRHG